MEKVKGDTSLQVNFKAVVDSDAVVAIANEADFSNTAEDIQSMQSTTEEVLAEELEGAAGGKPLGTQSCGALVGRRCWTNNGPVSV